jgi:hypothetical protein
MRYGYDERAEGASVDVGLMNIFRGLEAAPTEDITDELEYI